MLRLLLMDQPWPSPWVSAVSTHPMKPISAQVPAVCAFRRMLKKWRSECGTAGEGTGAAQWQILKKIPSSKSSTSCEWSKSLISLISLPFVWIHRSSSSKDPVKVSTNGRTAQRQGRNADTTWGVASLNLSCLHCNRNHFLRVFQRSKTKASNYDPSDRSLIQNRSRHLGFGCFCFQLDSHFERPSILGYDNGIMVVSCWFNVSFKLRSWDKKSKFDKLAIWMTWHAGSRSLPKYLTSGTKNLGPLRSFDGSLMWCWCWCLEWMKAVEIITGSTLYTVSHYQGKRFTDVTRAWCTSHHELRCQD